MKKHAIQFSKYFIGGSIYFWSGYAIFAVCYSVLGWSWFPAKVAADLVGWTLNYLAQRYWAFNSDNLKLREIQHIGRYIFIESVGFVLDYIIVGALNAVGITPYIGLFISAGFFTIWSFLWYKYWVFPQRNVADL